MEGSIVVLHRLLETPHQRPCDMLWPQENSSQAFSPTSLHIIAYHCISLPCLHRDCRSHAKGNLNSSGVSPFSRQCWLLVLRDTELLQSFRDMVQQSYAIQLANPLIMRNVLAWMFIFLPQVSPTSGSTSMKATLTFQDSFRP